MTIIVRTHGGLGNQLFQLVFARLLAAASGQAYAEIHDARYAHGFTRSTELDSAPAAPSAWQRAISALRLPKILERSGLRRNNALHVGGHIFLDGYFQNASDYQQFPAQELRRQLDRLREELRVDALQAPEPRTLVHLRLGDFFGNRDDALAHAKARIAVLPVASAIITNQEDIFDDPALTAVMQHRDCHLVGTRKHTPEDVLRLMSRYREIVTNNSTLALWAAVLGGRMTSFEDVRLQALYMHLSTATHEGTPPH